MGKVAKRIGLGLGIGLQRRAKTVLVTPPANPSNTVAPVVSGTLFAGQTLSCTTGTWTNSPTGYTYQWKRNGTDIAGATANTYLTVNADGGTNIACVVTAANASGNNLASSNTVAVSAGPSNTVAPVLSGTANQGQTLSCTTGTWIGATPITFAYQWRRAGVDIAGATASSYVLVAADAGNAITCAVIATNTTRSVTAVSNASATVVGAPVNTVAPVITGGQTVSQVLSCTTGTWTNSPTGYSYQWTRDGANISGATSATYTTVSLDASTTVGCDVTATSAIGSTTASAAGKVVSGTPVNTVAPVVSGTATQGQTLSCTTGTWIGAAPITFIYQWRRAGVDIAGAAASTYLLAAADAGNVISCAVSGSNSFGSITAISNATATVVAILTNFMFYNDPNNASFSTLVSTAYDTLLDQGGGSKVYSASIAARRPPQATGTGITKKVLNCSISTHCIGIPTTGFGDILSDQDENCILAMCVRPITGTGAGYIAAIANGGAILFGVQYNYTNSRFDIAFRKDDGLSTLITTPNGSAPGNQWYTIIIRKVGVNIYVSVNGVAQVLSTPAAPPRAKIALTAQAGSVCLCVGGINNTGPTYGGQIGLFYKILADYTQPQIDLLQSNLNGWLV